MQRFEYTLIWSAKRSHTCFQIECNSIKIIRFVSPKGSSPPLSRAYLTLIFPLRCFYHFNLFLSRIYVFLTHHVICDICPCHIGSCVVVSTLKSISIPFGQYINWIIYHYFLLKKSGEIKVDVYSNIIKNGTIENNIYINIANELVITHY